VSSAPKRKSAVRTIGTVSVPIIISVSIFIDSWIKWVVLGVGLFILQLTNGFSDVKAVARRFRRKKRLL